MKKRALWKDIFREIWRTKARFLSIFAIIMLGVGFFSGIKATGPDMLDTAENYFRELRLMDAKVQTTYGLREKDIGVLKNMDGVSAVQPGFSADAFLGDSGLIAKVYSFAPDNPLNRYVVASGRLPQASGEIAIDENGEMRGAFKPGDTITFTNPDADTNLEDTFRTLSYKVVGTVKSPMFISNLGRGTSRIGKGTADVFVVIPEQDFNLPVYTEAYMAFKDTTHLAPYSEAYDERIEQHVAGVKQALKGMPEERLAEIRTEGRQKLDEARGKIDDAKKQLDRADQKLKDAKAKLEEGRSSYEHGVEKLQSELEAGRAKLDSAERKLEQGRAELERNRKRIADGNIRLKEGQKRLEAEKKTAGPRISRGRELAESLRRVAQLPPDSLPAGQLQKLAAAASAADPGLGQAAAGYINGDVDAKTLLSAVSSFERGLNEGAAKLEKAQLELDATVKQLAEGAARIRAGERELAQGEAELAQGKADLETAERQGEDRLASAKAELDKGQREYDKGLAEYEKEKRKAERKIADGEKELAQGESELSELKPPKLYVLDRSSNPGYTEFSDNADRLASIATAFPVFFFLIAALVSLTTMTRMVEEQRLQIGTLKALGYGNRDILSKFLVYATLAGLSASAAGLAVGFTLFPNIIFNAYGALYNLPSVKTSFYPDYSIISVAVALLCTTMTALIAARVELRSNASVLMRPRAPKSGQRILLERLGLIWKRLGFTGKVTARNLFRYKQRMFMTVCGVAGCTALILTGFGLKDSIGDIAPLQYGKIKKYDAMVIFQDDGSKQLKRDYDKAIAGTPEITATLNATQETMTAIAKGVNNQDVTVFVPESPDKLKDFIVLKERNSEKPGSLPGEGAMVSEKLAKLYGLGTGDALTVQSSDNETFEIQVAGITENYAMHYLYMTPSYYESVFGKKPAVNSQLLNSRDASPAWEKAFGEKLTALPRVGMVNFTSGVSGAFEDTMDSMNVVVVVLIISAAALAFVVLYNLTNINVSERIRELSTIKVLGFYDKEVTMYIYRENIILTVLGIAAGLFLGIWLHGFVLQTAEVDMMMFSRKIKGISFVNASVLTLVFSTVVMVSMHFKLKRIDMIEALKSVE
ncbi:ABC transporter permease [Paenibacillus sp. DMB20]|uniref:ABC transporter permease n=1 Tax=Paenibacillus sp. DMB20 TaxID=1642570 RepID=UPI000627CB78|nr:ABC transporter permease [Paenibacillus sp. DMB20]KKO54191.1 ABC transporter permease [Paenibacillus sp. DMB20]